MNAKKELLQIVVETKQKIKCARITIENIIGVTRNSSKYILKLNYSEKDYNDFMNLLDFEYDEYQYVIQVLNGTVWLENGDWLFRSKELTDFEYWSHCEVPEIDEDCEDK